MAKQRFGYLWTYTLLEPRLRYLNFSRRGLLQVMTETYFRIGPLPEDLAELAFMLNVELEELQPLWDRRTQEAWSYIQEYMDNLQEEVDNHSEEKIAAGIASAESKKLSIDLDTAQEILGELMPVYEAFTTYWSHKKVTVDDCEKVKALIESGRATQQQIISAIERTARETPEDKKQYMKGVSTWLKGGFWMSRSTGKTRKLDQCNEASRDALLTKMGGGK